MTLWTPDSTAFCWFSYDQINHRLIVGFRDQTSYEYSGVPEYVFALLSSTPSRGRYFNHAIRNHYPSREVPFRAMSESPLS